MTLQLASLLILLLMVTGALFAQTTQPVALATLDVWPEGKMPGTATTQPQSDLPARPDGVQRITDVSRPMIAVFPAPMGTKPAPALVVCAGGGYSYVTYNKEGTDIAAWLNRAGISAVVLTYRVPDNRDGALQDLQRALSLSRTHAAEWNIDPQRLGVIGFSAGGNMCAKASTHDRTYAPIDAADAQSCRPSFAVLVYPAYLGKEGTLSPDLKVKADLGPTLIVHSDDDERFVEGSKLYHAALTEAKSPSDLLLYRTGGHGYGLRCTGEAKAWPDATLDWLRKRGFRD